MVRSKEELVQCANAWLEQARNDIRNQIVNFMQTTGLNETRVADLLAINVNELYSILESNVDISLLTFAKMLIATDNALEIKPIGQTPLANDGHAQQRRNGQPLRHTPPTRPNHERYGAQNEAHNRPRPMNGGYPMPPMGSVPTDRYGRPLPPPPGFMEGYPMPPMGGHNFGGGMPGVSRPMRNEPNAPMTVGGERPANELASHSRDELVQMIRDNFWDGEIDLDESPKSALVDFLMMKRGSMTPRVNQRAQRPMPQQAPQQMPQQAPQQMPQQAPQQMPQQAPQQMPQQAPTRDMLAEMREDVNEMANAPMMGEGVQVDESMEAFKAMLDNALAENPNLRDVIQQYNG